MKGNQNESRENMGSDFYTQHFKKVSLLSLLDIATINDQRCK